VYGRVLNGIPSLYPLKEPHLPVAAIRNVSMHCHASVEEQNCPWLRTTGLEQSSILGPLNHDEGFQCYSGDRGLLLVGFSHGRVGLHDPIGDLESFPWPRLFLGSQRKNGVTH
jgi:hypothetical protein